MSDEYLLWLDLETTGLHPHRGDVILEVAAILTTADTLKEVAPQPFHEVILHGYQKTRWLRPVLRYSSPLAQRTSPSMPSAPSPTAHRAGWVWPWPKRPRHGVVAPHC